MDYDGVMQIYFAMFSATMTTSAEFFWGSKSIMMMPYMAIPMDPIGVFFTRIVGICFLLLTLGRVMWGTPKDTFVKQTMGFHVGTILPFIGAAMSDGKHMTPWVWMMQIGMNVAFAAWGSTQM